MCPRRILDDVPEEKRIIPEILDFHAAKTPDKLYGFLPKGDAPEDGFSTLSYGALVKAIDATAWWLDETLGGKVTGGDFPTVPYIGPNDIRVRKAASMYVLLIAAAVKTHRKVLLPLPFNTIEATVRLVEVTGSKSVVAPKSHRNSWDGVRASMGDLPLVEMPEVTQLMHDGPVEPYQYTRTFEQALDDPALGHPDICHTGTTGNPKPLNYNGRAGYFMAEVALLSQSTPEEPLAIERFRDRYLPIVSPLSWVMTLFVALNLPINLGMVPIMLPESAPQPMNAAYLSKVIQYAPRGERNALMVGPEMLREIAKNPEYLERLREYDWVGFAGAPLDQPTGDLITQYTTVYSIIGSTDALHYPTLLNDPVDWNIQRFHSTFGGLHFEHFEGDFYELCVRRMPKDPRPAFHLDPTCSVIHTKDLWRPVEGRKGYWETAGRVDDFVKLATMTKFNTISIEQILNRHAEIETSMVDGEGRMKPFVIVQPALGSHEPREYVMERIWPAFEEANKKIFREANLTKELVLITDPDRPIIRKELKGTVDRRNTMAMYHKQIAEMYRKAGYAPTPMDTNGA